MNKQQRTPEKPQQGGGKEPPRQPSWPGRIWIPLALLFLLIFLWSRGGWMDDRQSIPYTRFKQELAKGNVVKVVAEGETLEGEFKEPITLLPGAKAGKAAEKKQEKVKTKKPKEQPEKVEAFETTLPPFGDEKLTQELMDQDVELVSKGSDTGGFWMVVANLLPFLLLIGLFVLLARGARQRMGGLMSIGRSRAKKFEKERAGVAFEAVAGLKEAKQELQEVIAFLKEPGRFAELGGRVPKGVLLVGPPGTGKTLLARAVAGEADVPFFSITGSDFMEMFVGVGAARVRDLFSKAKKNAPCIVFLDELDSIGRHRGAGLGGGHDEREQTLNQLLSAMDGFEPHDNVVVMAATNRPDILDPALLRPGRFDRRVTVPMPSLKERVAILKVHTREVPLAEDVDIEDLARSMPGRSGADLQNLVNEAALLAARHEKDAVGMDQFRTARDKILMGQLRGGIVLKGREKHAVAVHEAGHAVTALLSPEADPVEKISILPRGRSLGATQQLPEERYNLTEEYLRGRLKVMLGGRASEQAFLNTQTTGAADDLAQATRLARRMVGQWGMSEKLRHLAFQETDSEVFLGEQISRRRQYSEETAREIDTEVKSLLDELYDQVETLLRDNRDSVQRLAEALEEEETLEGDRLRELLGEYKENQPKAETTQEDQDVHDQAANAENAQTAG